MASSQNSAPKRWNSYLEFMGHHVLPKDDTREPTNTIIPGDDFGKTVYGNNYYISEEDLPEFYRLYHHEIISTGSCDYLTEKQNDTGPILIDIDMRFDINTNKRQYTFDHVTDLIYIYLTNLTKMYQFSDGDKFFTFILEKDSIVKCAEKNVTKDGLHLIIGINADRATQQLLRKRVANEIGETWSDLKLLNSWDDVVDAAIPGGTVWQMYGSKKPGNLQYKLTKIYEMEFDSADDEFSMRGITLEKFDLKKNLCKLSARYTEHPSFLFKSDFIKIREQAISNGEVTTSISGKKMKRIASMQAANEPEAMSTFNENKIFSVKNRDDMRALEKEWVDHVTRTRADYVLHEAYLYTMILPDSYYGPGTYSKWIRVGWALKNTSNRLFIVWMFFSAKYEMFDFSGIMEFYEKWKRFDSNALSGLTDRSIMHWARVDAKEAYNVVRFQSIDYYIDATLDVSKSDLKNCDKHRTKGCGDFDLAMVLHHMYKDEFKCVSVKNNIWYHYKGNRWEEVDSGTYLRKKISVELRDVYRRKLNKLMEKQYDSAKQEDETEENKIYKVKSNKLMDIIARLSQTNDKKNIMTEAKELFYDGTFMQKLDTNPYLLCFNNGVFDFKEKVFRKGYPEDYISKSTHIDYLDFDTIRTTRATHIAELHDFMNKLFPIPSLKDYMWEHLASTLIGASVKNQTFNMYIGAGQNGKSVLTELMKNTLGDYKGDVPLSLVTDKRTKIGGLAPEIVALKGVRYAVMQEPQKGDKLNEGIMKQLTSGADPIQARAPYMPAPVTFIPQFKLVVCSNNFLEIKSQDYGTWRRIRVVDFMSLFTDNPVSGDTDKPYQFKKVDDINEKFDEWKEVFMSMLVEKVLETGGGVTDCDIVMKSSNSYRESQDYIAEFIADKIIEHPHGSITKTALSNEFNIWYLGTYGKGGMPPIKDVQLYMDKRFGKFEKFKCWRGVKFREHDDLDMDSNVSDNEVEEDDNGSEINAEDL